MMNSSTALMKSPLRSLIATIGVATVITAAAANGDPVDRASQADQAGPANETPLALRLSRVRHSDLELITLDLQYEAIAGGPLDPLTSSCVASRLGARWLLPAAHETKVSEVVQDQVLNAATACKQKIKSTSSAEDELVTRQVAEAVARNLSANAKARLRLNEVKKEIRSCLNKTPEHEALGECFKNANPDLAEPHLLSRLLAISARWIN